VRKSAPQWIARTRENIGGLLSWWLQELSELGTLILARMAPQRVTFTRIRLQQQQGTIEIIKGTACQPVGTFVLDADGNWPSECEPPECMEAIRGTRAVIAVAPEHVLAHTLTLPAAVERNLEQAIALQLERECPIPFDRILVDRLSRRRTRAGSQIEVDVLIVERARIDRLRESARAWGLNVARIGVATADSVVGDFCRKQASGPSLRFTRIDRRLAITAAALAFLCVSVIAFQWSYERLQVGKKLDSLGTRASSATVLARQLEQDAKPAEALVRLMKSPDAVDTLVGLTADIPKDSWAYELDITAQFPRAPQIKLSGLAPVATTLTGVLTNTGRYDNVRLVYAMSAGLGSGQDRLQLTARLAPAGSAGVKAGKP